MVLDKHIGHAEIAVRDCRKARRSPIHEDWFGTAQIDGETFPFSTNCCDLENSGKIPRRV